MFRNKRLKKLYANFNQMNTTLTSYDVTSAAFDLIDQETESPDLFMRDGIFCKALSPPSTTKIHR
jgi:hypothetical protein